MGRATSIAGSTSMNLPTLSRLTLQRLVAMFFAVAHFCRRTKVRYATETVLHARVAELADALDLGSSTERCVGSTPSSRIRCSI